MFSLAVERPLAPYSTKLLFVRALNFFKNIAAVLEDLSHLQVDNAFCLLANLFFKLRFGALVCSCKPEAVSNVGSYQSKTPRI